MYAGTRARYLTYLRYLPLNIIIELEFNNVNIACVTSRRTFFLS